MGFHHVNDNWANKDSPKRLRFVFNADDEDVFNHIVNIGNLVT